MPADLELPVARLVERPAGLLQQQVDEVVAGLGLGVVVRVRLRRCRLLRRRHLGAQALQLLVERGLVGQQGGELLVALAQTRFELLQLLGGLPAHRCRLRQRARVEGQARRRPRRAAVGAGEPVRHMEQLAHRDHRVVERDRAMAVHGAVAERVDDPRLAEHRLACGLLETRVVDQRRQVVLVRQLQRRIVLVRPAHRQFQRAPRVEARRAWIGVHGRLGPRSGLEHGRPLTLQEGELAHLRADRAPV
jgi:hypothetical protein